jgi:hypothetical protein
MKKRVELNLDRWKNYKKSHVVFFTTSKLNPQSLTEISFLTAM